MAIRGVKKKGQIITLSILNTMYLAMGKEWISEETVEDTLYLGYFYFRASIIKLLRAKLMYDKACEFYRESECCFEIVKSAQKKVVAAYEGFKLACKDENFIKLQERYPYIKLDEAGINDIVAGKYKNLNDKENLFDTNEYFRDVANAAMQIMNDPSFTNVVEKYQTAIKYEKVYDRAWKGFDKLNAEGDAFKQQGNNYYAISIWLLLGDMLIEIGEY